MREIRFSNRAKEITLWVGAAFLLLLIHATAHLLPPFICAVIATYLFHPVVTFLTRRTGLPRIVWVILLYLAGFGALAWTIINVVPILQRQTIALAEYAPTALEQIDRYARQQPVLRDLGLKPELGQIEREVQARSNDVVELAQRLALPVLTEVVDGGIKFFIFLITTFYLLLHVEKLLAAFIGLTPRPYQHEIETLVSRINDALGAYLRSQLILVAIMSTATFIFLSVIKVDYPLVLGVLTGFLELIPFIGPYTAGGIAVSVALFQSTTPFGWSHLTLGIVVAIGYFVLRQLEDTLIIPALIGRVVHLNPILVIFVLLAGATLGGVLGLLIAVPVASVIRILVQYLYTKVLSREPPHVVAIASTDDPIERVRGAVDAGAKRLVLVSPDPNAALRQGGTFQQLQRLVAAEDLDVTLVSSDAIARGLAHTHGMRLAAQTF